MIKLLIPPSPFFASLQQTKSTVKPDIWGHLRETKCLLKTGDSLIPGSFALYPETVAAKGR